jgi:hypothetical protein
VRRVLHGRKDGAPLPYGRVHEANLHGEGHGGVVRKKGQCPGKLRRKGKREGPKAQP